jgi:hypothetical protein
MDLSIKKWVSNEDEIKYLKDKLNNLKEEQDILEKSIIEHIKTNHLENHLFKVGNKKLKFKSYKNYSAITHSYLMNTFDQFMDKDNSKMLLEYIRENRTFKIVNEIKLIEETNEK